MSAQPGPTARSRGSGSVWVARAVVARLGAAVATVVSAVLLAWALVVLAPGVPFDSQAQAEECGFGGGPVVRWTRPLVRLATFDLGTSCSVRPGTPVVELVARPAVRTAALVAAASASVMAWGTALAFVTAGRRWLVRGVAQAVSLAPTFALVHGLVTALNEGAWWAIGEGWIARPAWFALPDTPSATRTALAVVVLAVGSGALAEVHAEVEDALVRIRGAPWVDAARARGARTWPIVLRALLAPLAAAMANRTALLIGGALVVERVLLMRGVGALLWDAAEGRDYDLALAITAFAAVLVAGARFGADLVRLGVDPVLREAAR